MNSSFNTAPQINQDTDLVSLVTAIVNKDEDALTQLYELTVNKVYSLAHAMVSNKSDAEEVVCDIYSQLWHQASSYQPSRGSVMTWLLIICRSRSLDLIRRRKPEHTAGDDISRHADSNQHETVLPEDMINLLQEGSAIHKAMLELSEIQRQLIALSYFKGMSHQQIADTVQLPLGTTKSHIRRALQSLRTCIEL